MTYSDTDHYRDTLQAIRQVLGPELPNVDYGDHDHLRRLLARHEAVLAILADAGIVWESRSVERRIALQKGYQAP